MSTKPNTNQITYDTGSNKQDLNNILDTVVPIADYIALRNYTGRATQVRITADGIAGFFKRNGSASDNGGTVIVDGSGRSWERVFDRGNAIDFAWFGAKADYSGTPLYDGADASRVTGTDNAAALVAWIRAINSTPGSVGVFNGHYAVKTAHAVADRITLTRDLSISGYGTEASILDFVFEDATGATYQTSTTANLMLRLAGNGYDLEFSNFTVKATTNGGVIGSQTNINSVYYGKVWGISLETTGGGYAGGFKNVTLNNVRASRFNYVGIRFNYVDSVVINDCKGFNNGGSGFWAESCNSLVVSGGEFAYNGFRSSPGTGYGVTGSLEITTMVVRGAYCHNNYRKGIDSHGCVDFTCTDSVFEDNVCMHIGLPMISTTWKNTIPKTFNVTGNTFTQGGNAESLTWLRDVYSARVANGFTKNGFSVINVSIGEDNTAAHNVVFHGNTVNGGYRGYDVLTGSEDAGLF